MRIGFGKQAPGRSNIECSKRAKSLLTINIHALTIVSLLYRPSTIIIALVSITFQRDTMFTLLKVLFFYHCHGLVKGIKNNLELKKTQSMCDYPLHLRGNDDQRMYLINHSTKKLARFCC